MQKKLLTVAVAGALAAPVAAFAQVTVYGSIDTGLKQTSKILNATTGGTDSKLTMDSQNKKSNRVGLKGSHDLGGGLMANFTLEGSISSDTGGTDWNTARKSVVGLSKGGNSVDLGHNYTLNHSTEGVYDPLSQDYSGFHMGFQGATKTTRVSNSITGNFRFGTGGIGVQYAPGEVAGESWDTRTGINGDFAFGPVVVAAAVASYKTSASLGADSVTETQFGAAYTMGAFRFSGGYGVMDNDSAGEKTQLFGGVNYSFSPTLLGRLAYYNLKNESAAGAETGKGNVMVAAVEYSLSKTTMVYGAFSRGSFEGDLLGTATGSLQDGATSVGGGIVVVF